MSWVTPKTNWYGRTDEDGNYTGDRFNASDINRIKNNLEYLRDYAIQLYKEFNIDSLGVDRSPSDYFYADEINTLENNLKTISENTTKQQYEVTPYSPNGNTMTYADLNRLESMTLSIYERLRNQYEGRRTLTFNFGIKGGF